MKYQKIGFQNSKHDPLFLSLFRGAEMCRNTDKRKEGGKQLTVVVVVVVLISIPIEVMSLWKTTRRSERPGHHCQWIKADRPGSPRQVHCWQKCTMYIVEQLYYFNYSLYIEHNRGLKSNDFISWNLSICIAIVYSFSIVKTKVALPSTSSMQYLKTLTLYHILNVCH